MKTLNHNELLVGALVTSCLIPLFGWLSVILIPLCSVLWALSGMEGQDKFWRRLGVPLIWALCLMNYYALAAVPIAFGFLSMGYGLPSTQPFDEGSGLGRFYWKLTKGNEFISNILTRGTIYLGVIIPFLIVRFI